VRDRSLTAAQKVSRMDAEKDRFGDKLRDLEHARENTFFADREKELLEKLRRESAAAQALACPTCGKPLARRDEPPLRLEACPDGHGVWLTADAVKLLADEPARGALTRAAAALAAR